MYERDLSSPHATSILQTEKRPLLFAFIQGRSHLTRTPANNWPTGPRASHRLATIPPLPQAASQNTRTKVPTTPNIRVYWRAFADEKSKTERTNQPRRQVTQIRKRPRLFAIIQERSPKSTRLRHTGRQVREPAIALRPSRPSRKQPVKTPELECPPRPIFASIGVHLRTGRTKRNAPTNNHAKPV